MKNLAISPSFPVRLVRPTDSLAWSIRRGVYLVLAFVATLCALLVFVG